MSPNMHNNLRFGVMDDTKPFEFALCGVMDVTKRHKFICFGVMDVTKPYTVLGHGGNETL
jgi:hypothetical protein